MPTNEITPAAARKLAAEAKDRRDLSAFYSSLAAAAESLADQLDAANAENARLRVILADDDFAEDVARKCNDPAHDVRWCPTCEARSDGIAAYREAVALAASQEKASQP